MTRRIVRGEFRETYPLVRVSRRTEVNMSERELAPLAQAFYAATIAARGKDIKYPELSARAFYTCGTADGTHERELLPLNHEMTIALGHKNSGKHDVLFRNGNTIAGIHPVVYGINLEADDGEFATFHVIYTGLLGDVFLASAGLKPEDFKGDKKGFEAHVRRMQDFHKAIAGIGGDVK